MLRILAGVTLFILFATGCAGPAKTTRMTTPALPVEPPPEAMREFRAAWVATVANIDWPSSPGLPADSQKAELATLMDRAQALGLNAIIFQVRPMADALYASELEPWSYYLTGRQGQDPGYDPLALAIEEAHARGMELHAWFNPFRAGHPTSDSTYAEGHVRNAHPEWVRQYGELLWLDPGSPEARDHSMAVMLDVVERYDVDGIHMDDYFYPYPIRDADGDPVDFPDLATWEAAAFQGTREDWRRENVNSFVESLYVAVKATRPHVRVGISPFGIWRPGHPENVRGFDQYEGLYADARLWLRNGWVDYFTPQLYWALESEGQPYEDLLHWWIGENRQNRHMWPGNYASRVLLEGGAYWGPEEVARQVEVTRHVAGATGNVHFSMRALMPGTNRFEVTPDSLDPGSGPAPNQGDLLHRQVYAEPALPPATTWLGGGAPGVPRTVWEGRSVHLEPAPGVDPFVWHVREWDGSEWSLRLVPGRERILRFEGTPPEFVVVSAVSRLGLEGYPSWAVRTIVTEE